MCGFVAVTRLQQLEGSGVPLCIDGFANLRQDDKQEIELYKVGKAARARPISQVGTFSAAKRIGVVGRT